MKKAICLWTLRTAFGRGYKSSAALCKFDLENGRVCVISKIISPYSKEGDYTEAFKALMKKHNVSQNEILLSFPEIALTNLQNEEKLKELAKNFKCTNLLKQ